MKDVGVHNEIAAARLLDALHRAGVRDVCISPGGRSTPLAVALARDDRLRSWCITDERASAFFALGAALASGRPTAVICTSGTAAANFLPAVVEAYWSEVPLVVLTADRPAELRECGAPQTIRQPGLFGSHVKWAAELATPDAVAAYAAHAGSVASRAVAVALAAPRGPVHINVPYREPLVADDAAAAVGTGDRGSESTRIHLPRLTAEEEAVREFAKEAAGRRGLIVCGPRLDGDAGAAIVSLAGVLGWPILADPLSGLRHGVGGRSLVVDAYDILLRDSRFAEECRPECVLRFGALSASKPLARFLAGAERQTLVTTTTRWSDPDGCLDRVVFGDVADFCQRVADAAPTPAPVSWCRDWIAASTEVRCELDRLVDGEATLIEGVLARRVFESLEDGECLVVGNSMPVRDIDTFVGASGKLLRIHANRGANGIDGVLATALGMAALHAGRCTLLIGDLSLLYDIGSLQIAARYPIDLRIVVANNDGGGIFSYLPQAGLGAAFEPFFGTPHGLGFADAARMCGASHRLVTDVGELPAALERRPGLQIVEVRTQRDVNVSRSRELVARALERLRDGCRATV